MTGPHPALPFGLLLAIGSVVALRSAVAARRAGVPVLTFGDGDDAHDFLGRVFRGLSALLVAVFGLRIAWPGVDRTMGAIPWLATPAIGWSGLALIAVGGAIVGSAQWQMGRSWRIGLGRETTPLVTAGWFRVSRNPVFLGFLIMLAGCWLSAPSSLTTCLLVAGWLSMSVQARLEEAHLDRENGRDYAGYRARVRRWL